MSEKQRSRLSAIMNYFEEDNNEEVDENEDEDVNEDEEEEMSEEQKRLSFNDMRKQSDGLDDNEVADEEKDDKQKDDDGKDNEEKDDNGKETNISEEIEKRVKEISSTIQDEVLQIPIMNICAQIYNRIVDQLQDKEDQQVISENDVFNDRLEKHVKALLWVYWDLNSKRKIECIRMPIKKDTINVVNTITNRLLNRLKNEDLNEETIGNMKKNLIICENMQKLFKNEKFVLKDNDVYNFFLMLKEVGIKEYLNTKMMSYTIKIIEKYMPLLNSQIEEKLEKAKLTNKECEEYRERLKIANDAIQELLANAKKNNTQGFFYIKQCMNVIITQYDHIIESIEQIPAFGTQKDKSNDHEDKSSNTTKTSTIDDQNIFETISSNNKDNIQTGNDQQNINTLPELNDYDYSADSRLSFGPSGLQTKSNTEVISNGNSIETSLSEQSISEIKEEKSEEKSDIENISNEENDISDRISFKPSVSETKEKETKRKYQERVSKKRNKVLEAIETDIKRLENDTDTYSHNKTDLNGKNTKQTTQKIAKKSEPLGKTSIEYRTKHTNDIKNQIKQLNASADKLRKDTNFTTYTFYPNLVQETPKREKSDYETEKKIEEKLEKNIKAKELKKKTKNLSVIEQIKTEIETINLYIKNIDSKIKDDKKGHTGNVKILEKLRKEKQLELDKLKKEQQKLKKYKDIKELTFRPDIKRKGTIKPKIKKIEKQLNQPMQTQTNKNNINKNQKETVVNTTKKVVPKATKNDKKQNKQQQNKQHVAKIESKQTVVVPPKKKPIIKNTSEKTTESKGKKIETGIPAEKKAVKIKVNKTNQKSTVINNKNNNLNKEKTEKNKKHPDIQKKSNNSSKTLAAFDKQVQIISSKNKLISIKHTVKSNSKK